MPLETDVAYRCPYCGEENFLGIDPTGGSHQRLTEDCPVCCNPISFGVHVDGDGDTVIDSAQAES